MLAKRIPTILPQLSAAESIETTRIYSALGMLSVGQPLLATRPFRAPHHTISEAGLVGGRSTPMPGEISLAHNGVLCRSNTSYQPAATGFIKKRLFFLCEKYRGCSAASASRVGRGLASRLQPAAA